MNKQDSINYELLLKSIYLKLALYGYNEISLRANDLKVNVPKIQALFEQYNIYTYDLFVKTPVSETYDRYKNNIINMFINNGVGYFNNNYDSIIINCNSYYIKRVLEEMINYKELINECCKIFINEYMFSNNDIITRRKLIRND